MTLQKPTLPGLKKIQAEAEVLDATVVRKNYTDVENLQEADHPKGYETFWKVQVEAEHQEELHIFLNGIATRGLGRAVEETMTGYIVYMDRRRASASSIYRTINDWQKKLLVFSLVVTCLHYCSGYLLSNKNF